MTIGHAARVVSGGQHHLNLQPRAQVVQRDGFDMHVMLRQRVAQALRHVVARRQAGHGPHVHVVFGIDVNQRVEHA